MSESSPDSLGQLEREIQRLKEIKKIADLQREKKEIEESMEDVLHPYTHMLKKIGSALGERFVKTLNAIEEQDKKEEAERRKATEPESAKKAPTIFKCKLVDCNKVFSTMEERDAHMAMAHGIAEKCGYVNCNHIFMGQDEKYRHLREAHDWNGVSDFSTEARAKKLVEA